MKMMNKIALGASGVVAGAVLTVIGTTIAVKSNEEKLNENFKMKERTAELDARKAELEKKIERLDNIGTGVAAVAISGLVVVAATLSAVGDEGNSRRIRDLESELGRVRDLEYKIERAENNGYGVSDRLDYVEYYLNKNDSEWDNERVETENNEYDDYSEIFETIEE